jgi:glycosyltransferase involved in cell wall biosynthesis
VRSEDLDRIPLAERARMALTYEAHDHGRRLIREAIERSRPDLVHFHNLYPQLGVSAVEEADALGCATVHTLHNYRLSCLAGTHLLRLDICERCKPTAFVPGMVRGCYRGSRLQSVLAARATTRQWRDMVARGLPLRVLALTDFMRQKYIAHGASPDRLVHKPNSVDRGEPAPPEARHGVLTAGRLSPEKGIVPLMRVWPANAPTLTVAGSGPEEDEVSAAQGPNVRYLGRLQPSDLRAAMRAARVVALPSVGPEPMPLVALESFSEGTPVVAFDGWSLGAMVKDVSHDCVVAFRDFPALARRAREITDAWYWDKISARCVAMHASTYSHQRNLAILERVYVDAIAERHSR